MALEWAERNEAEILSCDSVALYRGMDIGSAKPNHEEQTRVKHHGLDLANVDQRYDVSQYNKYAEAIIEEVYQRKGKVLVVGGSGFYLRSFFSAVVDEVMVSNEIKNSVEELYQLEGLDGLIEKLNNLNPVRVIKALERCMATGSTLLELKVEFEKKPTPYCNFQKKTCLVDRGDEDIENLIKFRTQSMLANGLIEEVEGLIDRGLLHNYPASSSVGYREILSYLRGELSRDELGPAIALSTRQLVSKQRKWFRKYYQADQILIPTGGEPLNLDDLIWHSDT